MARGAPAHLVDPVGRVEKAMEKANSGVHQRHAWTKGVYSATLTTLDQYLKVSGRSVAVDLHFLSILHCINTLLREYLLPSGYSRLQAALEHPH